MEDVGNGKREEIKLSRCSGKHSKTSSLLERQEYLDEVIMEAPLRIQILWWDT